MSAEDEDVGGVRQVDFTFFTKKKKKSKLKNRVLLVCG